MENSEHAYELIGMFNYKIVTLHSLTLFLYVNMTLLETSLIIFH